MTTTIETPAAEYHRLTAEEEALRAAHRGTRPPEVTERLRAIDARIREVRANPTAGYQLPAAAAGLVAHAQAHGWLTLVCWSGPDYTPGTAPHVSVQVGRLLTDEEAAETRGDRWLFDLAWHSRGCLPGRLRLFSGLAVTPDEPWHHEAPSVRGIRAVIAAHPGGAR